MRITKRILSILSVVAVMFSLSVESAFAQNRMLKGVVVDDTDLGVIGAAVMIKGTTTGVATDMDGNFLLSCKTGDVLVISSVGYDDVEYTVTEKDNVTIRLSVAQEILDDVVVIGYGTTRAKNFTGSVDVMKMEDSPVADLALNTASDMLRGRMSGVVMGAESASTGSKSSILVRGRKSINSTSTMPLLVVNGVIYSGNIEDIDSNAIESMSVLKDATSLAAYGSKAANGVIMITLKKGKEGKPMINFSTSQSVATPTYKQKFLSPEDYIKYRNARLGYDDLTRTDFMSFLEKENYEKGKTTDWWDLVHQTGYTQQYNLSVSGRTDKSNYYLALGRNDQKGILVGDETSRNNYSLNLSSNINDYVEIGSNIALTSTSNNSKTAGSNTYWSPYMEPYLKDGKTLRYYIEGINSSSINPLWSHVYGADRDNSSYNFTLGGYLNVKLPWVEGLSYRMNLSYTRRESKNYSITHEWDTPVLLANDWDGIGQTSAYYNLANANATVSNSITSNWVIDNILSYARAFGQHYVSASLVYTRDSAESTADSMNGKGFIAAGNTLLGWHNIGSADTVTITSPSYTLHTDVGYLARVMYSYKDTYHFNASIRRDGSSVFGEESKWGNFPALGAAWTITNEDFMKDIKWLDMLKLKLSWGKNGAQTLSPYGTLSTIALAKSGGIPYYVNNKINWGQRINVLGNPTLGWQTTTSWNGGFEADFLKGRIHVDVNAYHSKTTDQIFNRNIPVMSTGITNQSATMGQVDNNGLEINLNTVNMKKGDLTWTSDWVFTMNRNKLVELYGDGQNDITSSLFIGESLGSIYGYVTEGIFQEGADAGRPIFLKADGTPTQNPSATEDRKILGNTNENFRLSWGNTLRYKNWQFYAMFQGIFGGAGYGLANNTFAYVTYDTTASISALDIPFWTKQQPNNTYPAPNVNEAKYAIYNSFGHVRLQDASVSYNLKSVASKIGLNSARVTLSGRNLFYIAPNWKMSDPQARSAMNCYLPRTVSLGLNVTF